MSLGLEHFGEMRWELAACLFIVWVVVYFSLWKSVRSSSRVLYFTATVPFGLVLMFLGHSLSLEGADIGLKYLFLPKWEMLLDSKVSSSTNLSGPLEYPPNNSLTGHAGMD